MAPRGRNLPRIPNPPPGTPTPGQKPKPPPKPKPALPANIIGRYAAKPNAPAGTKAVKRGGGKGTGYVLVRNPAKPSTTPPAAAPPAAPDAPVDPYAKYPWATTQLAAIDKAGQQAQDYVANKVAPWLSQSLTNLTGVDPAKPGINKTMQDQHLGNVKGVVGGAMDAASVAAPATFAPTGAGVIAGSPTSYLVGAAQEGAAGRKSGMMQAAEAQTALNTLRPNTQAQAYTYQLAALQAGLPALYAERRAAARSKIDEFIQTFENRKSEYDRTLAVSKQNAETNAAMKLLLLKSTDTRAANTITAATQRTQAQIDARRIAADKAFARANSASALVTGKGWRRLPPGAGTNGLNVETSSDGVLVYKPKAAGAVPTAAAVARANGADNNSVFKKVFDLYDSTAISTDRDSATATLIDLLTTMQPKDPRKFEAWMKRITPVLNRVKPEYGDWVNSAIAGVPGTSANGFPR